MINKNVHNLFDLFLALSFYFWLVVFTAWRDIKRDKKIYHHSHKPQTLNSASVSNKFLQTNNIKNENDAKWAWKLESKKTITPYNT